MILKKTDHSSDDIEMNEESSVPLHIEWKRIDDLERKIYNHRAKYIQWKGHFEVHHNFNEILSLEEYSQAIDNAFAAAVEPIIQKFNAQDRIAFEISSEGLNKPIFLRPVSKIHFDKKSFLNQITQSVSPIRNSFYLEN